MPIVSPTFTSSKDARIDDGGFAFPHRQEDLWRITRKYLPFAHPVGD
jgi:hypothetical protein